jgi:hypothetical protein
MAAPVVRALIMARAAVVAVQVTAQAALSAASVALGALES